MSKEFHYASLGKRLLDARSEVGDEDANTAILINGPPSNIKKRNTGGGLPYVLVTTRQKSVRRY
jgi:hypothetical protein